MTHDTHSSRHRTAKPGGSEQRRPGWIVALALMLVVLVHGCDGGGGPNTKRSFRAVLVEPTPGSVGLGCNANGTCLDTIRVTFNNAIDTTAVLDVSRPRYFLATLSGGGFILDSLGTTVTNEMRTLVIPFQFAPTSTYEFTLLDARDLEGNRLENTAATLFTIGSCQNDCP